MTKPWIENCSMHAIMVGNHYDPGQNSMLIQIVDPGVFPPEPKYKFNEVWKFYFLDAEDSDIDKYGEDSLIGDMQARLLVGLLNRALIENINVIVHCHAGFCRSGAVTEVGVMMGFTDTKKFRSPNMRVKHKLMGILGYLYTNEEQI